ncbi:follistatin-related protein 1 [Pteropus vampyrus]|uniref:Follistatin-related protein 1 n=1 Tax=Pteropus vampyrus TaxID=132908 RepID=A0A6P6C8G1_PTEVA|nr:follistatin-related protein 1 [Pteropus vampyrus]
MGGAGGQAVGEGGVLRGGEARSDFLRGWRSAKLQPSSSLQPPCPAPSGDRDGTMMWTRWLALALAAVAWVHAEEELRSKSKICANVFCGAGRECAVTEKGEPTCLCIEQCKPHKRPVCGSNGKTYLNHCELHRDACLTGSKIQVDYDGHCKGKECSHYILTAAVGSQGTKQCGNFDNGDSRLDSSEFLKFVEQNETAINITTYADQENNKLLRGLCVDALIELSDENADWKLSFQEFLQCLNPSFNPPEKKCALEDETYADGAETEVDCNRCVCACGNWVCTAMTCDGKNQKGAQTQREEEMTRYVQELQKHQETAEKSKRVSTKEI